MTTTHEMPASTREIGSGLAGQAGQAADEHLATGWEPELAAHDTFLRRYLFAWARMCATFATTAGGRAVWTPDFAASDQGGPGSFFTGATLLRPPAPAAFAATLDAVERFYAGSDSTVYLWSAWPTSDLRSRGWSLIGHPPLMIRPPAIAQPPLERSGDRHVAEVRDAADLVAWERVAVEGYPLPELLPFRPGRLVDASVLGDRRLRLTLGYDGDQPVSIGALYTDYADYADYAGRIDPAEAGESGNPGRAGDPGWAGDPGEARDGGAEAPPPGAAINDVGLFVLGVTLPSARGLGHWRAHAVQRLRLAPELWMCAAFSDDSRPGAERLGFVPVTRLTLWARDHGRR